MKTWGKWIGIVAIGAIAGGWMGYNDFSPSQTLFTLIGLALVVVLLLLAPILHALRFSRNADRVEAFLRRSQAKSVFYRLSLDAAYGNFDEVERLIPRLRNRQAQASMRAMLHLERRQLAQARAEANNLRSAVQRNYGLALIAVCEEDWDSFAKYKAGTRHPKLIPVLEAEAAFKQGRPEEADRFGRLAIEAARGLQLFLLVRSLERQERNPERRTYF